MNKNNVDPITLEIIMNGFRSLTDETYLSLKQSAYSTNIKERADHSTAVCDATGRLIAQADSSLPIHMSSILGMMRAILDIYPTDEIKNGDVFIANDPHVAGGSHLPDINMAMPIFDGDQLIAFICNIAHHADIGGMVAGSTAGKMSEIFQEGLRIPAIKLYKEGVLQEQLFRLLLLNVRMPEERRGDYYAQIASCHLGVRRFNELIIRYSKTVILSAFDEIISCTELRLRNAIAGVLDGQYYFEDVMDDDGFGEINIPIKLKIDIRGNRIVFDFTGTAPQVKGNINMPRTVTGSSVCCAVKMLFDPDIPNNQAIIDVCEIKAEAGTFVDCSFPAAVASRAHGCQRIIDMIIGALAEAMPERVTGASNGANTTIVLSGKNPTNGEDYIYYETLGGGLGGRAGQDGRDGVQAHSTNTSNLPIEAIEMEYPLRVLEYGLVEDSGGPGKYRGGMGIRRVITPVNHACVLNGTGERFANCPWGIFGGRSGSTGRFLHTTSDNEQKLLPAKVSDYIFEDGEKITIETPGAGGYGNPKGREIAMLANDRLSEKFTQEYLSKNYPLEN